MTFPHPVIPLAALFLAATLLPGCHQLTETETKRRIQEADQKAATGDYKAALKHYEAALDGTPATADLHYKMGVIYDEKLKAPIPAMHHFQRYLQLAPKGTYAKEARAYEKEGQMKILTQLHRGSFMTQAEAVRLKNENLSLRKQLIELRAQKSQPPPAATPRTADSRANEPRQKPIPPGSRVHVVQSGETLASISLKYYKSRARWKDIQDANFYSLEGTAKIKPGQKLIIP